MPTCDIHRLQGLVYARRQRARDSQDITTSKDHELEDDKAAELALQLYNRMSIEQDHMVHSNHDSQVLTVALPRLINLKTIEIQNTNICMIRATSRVCSTSHGWCRRMTPTAA